MRSRRACGRSAGSRAHHDDPVCEKRRLLDRVGDEHDRLGSSVQMRCNSRLSSSRACASSAANGSSIKSTDGSWTSARQSDTRCCIPPDSSWGRRPSNPSSPAATGRDIPDGDDVAAFVDDDTVMKVCAGAGVVRDDRDAVADLRRARTPGERAPTCVVVPATCTAHRLVKTSGLPASC